jgi:hypothetical protein
MAGRAVAGAVLSLVVAVVAASAQSDPWFGKTTKVAFKPCGLAVKGVSGFSFECPAKDWTSRLLPDTPKTDWRSLPGGVVLLVLTHNKSETVVRLEQSALRRALAPEDVTEELANIEVDVIREQQPRAEEFQRRVVAVEGRRVVVVQYRRFGLKALENVRQYSYFVGSVLYRVVCVAPPAQFAQHEPIFAHVAASFVPVAPVEFPGE